MIPDKIAESIKAQIERLARDAADRYDGIHGQPEDWLDFDFRRQWVERIVREVLIDWLSGKRA